MEEPKGSIVTVTIANANMDLEKRVTRVDVDTNDFTSQEDLRRHIFYNVKVTTLFI